MAIGNYVSSKSGGSVQTSAGKGGQETKLASVAFVFTEQDDIVEKLTETDKIFEEIENVSDYFEKDGLYYGTFSPNICADTKKANCYLQWKAL